MADPVKWLSNVVGQTGISPAWLRKAMDAGVVTPDMQPEQAYKAAQQFFMTSNYPPQARQLQLPMPDAAPDIRALIRYGVSGPGVPVTPMPSTRYTPDMQANAQQNIDVVANGPRVTQRQGELIPSPIDPRRFTMSDPAQQAAPSGYTPAMQAEAMRRLDPTFAEAADFHTRDIDEPEYLNPHRTLGLPGRVASPEELARQRMYDQAAGYVEDIRNNPESRALATFNRQGPGVPVGGPAGGPRDLVAMPPNMPWHQRVASHARNLVDGLSGEELLAGVGAAAAAGALYRSMPKGPEAKQAMADPGAPAIQSGGEADLVQETRPAPVVVPSPPATEWAADKADPAAEAAWVEKFKRGYNRHNETVMGPPEHRQTAASFSEKGIPYARALEIMKGSPATAAERAMILGRPSVR